MKIKSKYVKVLLNELIRETEQIESRKGFQIIGELIGLRENYLYKISLLVKKKPDGDVSFRDALAGKILRHLKYNDLKEFTSKVDNPINSQLLQSLGPYYSYVRRSIDEGTLFRSPVQIFQRDGKVCMELKGKRLHYLGEVKLRQGVLFIPLESNAEKAFYHVYKIGDCQGPVVLQGTFSGVSNNFEPIAGRAILMKAEKEFSSLKNAELKIDELTKSKSLDERRLAEYFQRYSDNNLTLKRVYTFDNRDLGNCK